MCGDTYLGYQENGSFSVCQTHLSSMPSLLSPEDGNKDSELCAPSGIADNKIRKPSHTESVSALTHLIYSHATFAHVDLSDVITVLC